MSHKKIEFSRKPTEHETNKFIDNWVLGDLNSKQIKNKLKRTTIYLPEELHQKLKIMAAKTNTSMTDIIIQTLEKNLI